jgi:hypothetical protein
MRDLETHPLQSNGGGEASVPGATITNDFPVLVFLELGDTSCQCMQRDVMGSLKMSFTPFLVCPNIKQQDPLARICFFLDLFGTVVRNRPGNKKSPKIKEGENSYDDEESEFTAQGSFS